MTDQAASHPEPEPRAHRLAAASLLKALHRLSPEHELDALAERLGAAGQWAEGLVELAGAAADNDPDAGLLARGHRLACGGIEPGTTSGLTALRPVADSLRWPPRQHPVATRHVPAGPLHLSPDEFLPGDGEAAPPSLDLSALLSRGPSLAPATHPGAVVERLAALTGRALHALAGSEPDVSLADEAHVAAAFAASLASQEQEQPRWRLLALSLGGIQKFIFRSVPAVEDDESLRGEKGMARRLRARSFYVGLLGHFAARSILDATGLPAVNIVGDAGGRTLLLLPQGPEIDRRTTSALNRVRSWFAANLIAPLRLDVAMSDPLNEQDFGRDRFTRTYRELDARLAAGRLAVSDPTLRQDGRWSDDGWVASDDVSLPVDRHGWHRFFARLGKQLPKAQWLSLDDTGGLLDPLEICGYQLTLHATPPPGPRLYRLRWAEDDLVSPRLLVAAHVPRRSDDNEQRVTAISAGDGDEETLDLPGHGGVLTFGHLAQLATDEQDAALAHPMLAALKADVDLLGNVMGHGLGEQVSFARMAGLSRGLDLFFKGMLVEQMRQVFPHIYTVFSGGDDLMLIGPWYDLVRLAERLEGWFDRFAGEGSGLTLSAGLVFAGSRTPAHHLASAGEQALEQAKDAGRNRITFGSVTCTWPQFIKGLELHRLMRDMAQPADGQQPALGGSLVHRLLQIGLMARRSAGNGKASLHDLKWRAQLSYQLKRNMPDTDRPDVARLHEVLVGITSSEKAASLVIGASLTLYRLRGHRTPAAEEIAS